MHATLQLCSALTIWMGLGLGVGLELVLGLVLELVRVRLGSGLGLHNWPNVQHIWWNGQHIWFKCTAHLVKRAVRLVKRADWPNAPYISNVFEISINIPTPLVFNASHWVGYCQNIAPLFGQDTGNYNVVKGFDNKYSCFDTISESDIRQTEIPYQYCTPVFWHKTKTSSDCSLYLNSWTAEIKELKCILVR